MNNGASMPKDINAWMMPPMVCVAISPRQAFSAAAFSRSSNPMRPFSWERQTRKSGASANMSAAASSSWAVFTGENTPETTTARTPQRRMSWTALLSSSRPSGAISRPSNSWPPPIIYVEPPMASWRARGQSTNGGNNWVAGNASRTTAVGDRLRRSSKALVKWVVPTITASIVPL